MSDLASRPSVLRVVAVAVALAVVFAFSVPDPEPRWFAPVRVVVAVILLGAVLTTHRITRNGGALVLALMGWVLAVTALHGRLSFGIAFATVAAVALFALAQQTGAQHGAFRAGLLLFAVATIAVNAWSFLHPEVDAGGHEFYYVGGKNALALTFLPLIYLLHVRWRPRHPVLRLVRAASIVLALGAVVLAGSATGLIMVVAYLAFLVHQGRICRKWAWWFASIPVLHLALVSGWLLNASGWARGFVEGSLGKSADFTDRSAIWAAVWARVKEEPFGEGRGYSFLTELFPGIGEAHNMLLEALITAGWPCLVMLLALVARLMRDSARRTGGGAGVYFLWLAGVIGSMESYTYHFGFWLLLGLVAAHDVSASETGADADPTRNQRPVARLRR